MKRKRRNTYLVSALTLALVFALVILIFRDALPGIGKNLRAVPLWGVLLLLALGFAYEAMESAVCLVIIHHKKPDCTLADALRVTFLGVFGNIATMGAGTLPMQSYCLYRRGLDAGSGLGIMASEYVLHKISVLLYATAALLLGGEWLRGGANGLARYILIGYAIGALIVLALTLIYTWDRVLALVLRLLDGLLHKPKWAARRKKWAGSLTQLNREAKKVLLVPSLAVKGIAVSLAKLFVLYTIPYAALRLLGCTALTFGQAQLLAALMLLITNALPNVAGVGPMEFAFLLLFAPWSDTTVASSALVLYRVATYFFPFLLSVIVFLCEENRSLKGFDAQSAE